MGNTMGLRLQVPLGLYMNLLGVKGFHSGYEVRSPLGNLTIGKKGLQVVTAGSLVASGTDLG